MPCLCAVRYLPSVPGGATCSVLLDGLDGLRYTFAATNESMSMYFFSADRAR